jgi:tetratricopeptide (TPR) repeat protein
MNRLRIASLVIALSGAALLVTSLPARADEVQDISKLMKQGQLVPALERANAYLATHPKDAQARFMKGLILTEQSKSADAIRVFNDLTVDFPELPEPYNNLAVLYASQGQYEKAKTSLEMAIRTHPSYATAHENLGDIYAKMATMAYDKALQLDKGNASAQTKLALVKELFSGGSSARPAKSSGKADTTKPQEAPPTLAPLATAPAPAAAPAKVAVTTKPAVAVAEAKPAHSAEMGEATEAVKAWANAWASRDVKAYLAFYAPDFKVPGGNRSAWESSRKERITSPKSIDVKVSDVKVDIENSNHAKIKFKQYYRSDRLKNNSKKTLIMVKSNGKWLIQEERVGH